MKKSFVNVRQHEPERLWWMKKRKITWNISKTKYAVIKRAYLNDNFDGIRLSAVCRSRCQRDDAHDRGAINTRYRETDVSYRTVDRTAATQRRALQDNYGCSCWMLLVAVATAAASSMCNVTAQSTHYEHNVATTTLCAIKTCHFHYYDNCGKYWPTLIIP